MPVSAASKAGFKVGNVLAAVSSQTVHTPVDRPPRAKINVGVILHGKLRELAVTLGELSSDARCVANAADKGATAPQNASAVLQSACPQPSWMRSHAASWAWRCSTREDGATSFIALPTSS